MALLSVTWLQISFFIQNLSFYCKINLVKYIFNTISKYRSYWMILKSLLLWINCETAQYFGLLFRYFESNSVTKPHVFSRAFVTHFSILTIATESKKYLLSFQMKLTWERRICEKQKTFSNTNITCMQQLWTLSPRKHWRNWLAHLRTWWHRIQWCPNNCQLFVFSAFYCTSLR